MCLLPPSCSCAPLKWGVCPPAGKPATPLLSPPTVAVNDPPVVDYQSYTSVEDTVIITSAADGLLRGASDVEGDPLTVVSSSNPANGRVTVAADGSFTYAPNANLNGWDSFQFTVSDGNGGFTTATASIWLGGPVWCGCCVEWLHS